MTQPALQIRRATVEHAAAICKVHQAAVRGLCTAEYTPEQIEAWIGDRVPAGYACAMQKGGETMFVAQRGGRVVGFASIFEGVLRALYVDPEAGRGTGILLLRAVEAEARRRGVDILSLNATLTAIGFYRKHGYEIVGPAREVRNGVALPAVAMRRELE